MKTISVEEYRTMTGQGKKWSNAKRTSACLKCGLIWPKKGGDCPAMACDGKLRTFASKMEATVYSRLVKEYGSERVYCQPSFPIIGISRSANGTALKFSPDFAVRGYVIPRDGLPFLIIEAKNPKRMSRDYLIRKAAFETTYLTKVTEVSE